LPIAAVVLSRAEVQVEAQLALDDAARHVLNTMYAVGQTGLSSSSAITALSFTMPDAPTLPAAEWISLAGAQIVNWVPSSSPSTSTSVEGVRQRRRSAASSGSSKGELRLDLKLRWRSTQRPRVRHGRADAQRLERPALYLSGVKVEVRQGLAAFYGDTDAQGYVTLEVAKKRL